MNSKYLQEVENEFDFSSLDGKKLYGHFIHPENFLLSLKTYHHLCK